MNRVGRLLLRGGRKIIHLLATIIGLSIFFLIASYILSLIFGSPLDNIDSKKVAEEECYEAIIFRETSVDNNYEVIGKYPPNRNALMYESIFKHPVNIDIKNEEEFNSRYLQYNEQCEAVSFTVISNKEKANG